jgi:hypothetical protein
MTMYRVSKQIATVLFVAGLVCVACAGQSSTAQTGQNLDKPTGITIAGLTEPLVFHHEAPQLAANVRDYLYVGPVSAKRLGKKSYYLWLGEWSTIDRVSVDESKGPYAPAIVVMLDGAPMELRDSAEIRHEYGEFRNPYVLPVASNQQVYIRVSRAQLNRMASATTVKIRVSHDDELRVYSLWKGDITLIASVAKGPVVTGKQPLVKNE